MAIPASTDEIEEFTPSVLANVPVPPVFLMRPAGEREYRAFEHQLRRHALHFHGTGDLRAEMLNALKQLWSPAEFEANRARLESYWALVDQDGVSDPAEVEAVNELAARLGKAWPRLAEMVADTARFNDEAGRIAASMFIIGWRGIDVEFERSDGLVPLARIDAVEAALSRIETQAKEDKVAGVLRPGTAFLELAAKAYSSLALSETERKNSSSPPSSPPAPNGSTKTRSNRTAGRKSKASASSGSRAA